MFYVPQDLGKVAESTTDLIVDTSTDVYAAAIATSGQQAPSRKLS